MGRHAALTMPDIAIVGGGLAGLSLAQRLQAAGRRVAVFESAARPGGRILSCPPGCRGDQASAAEFQYDLGPAWIWPALQPRMASFIAQYELELFPQWHNGSSLYHAQRHATPQRYVDNTTYAAARRIKGGARRLIDVLLQQMPAGTLHLNHHLLQVIEQPGHVELCFRVADAELRLTAGQLVLTIPPRLLADSVTFTPKLDSRLHELMHGTSTWMAGHAKAVIHYPNAFWRDSGFSGNAIASYQGAALAEIFDACSAAGEHAALAGFFALPPPLRRKYRNDLEALIVEQLVRLFGKNAAAAEEIIIKDWCDEARTATEADVVPLVDHPRYGHAWLQREHWNGKLYFAGTESAPQFGGYLEGALESSQRVAAQLLM